jgi:hypothetical protein
MLVELHVEPLFTFFRKISMSRHARVRLLHVMTGEPNERVAGQES